MAARKKTTGKSQKRTISWWQPLLLGSLAVLLVIGGFLWGTRATDRAISFGGLPTVPPPGTNPTVAPTELATPPPATAPPVTEIVTIAPTAPPTPETNPPTTALPSTPPIYDPIFPPPTLPPGLAQPSPGARVLVPSLGEGVVIYQGKTGLNQVALTFDSGWLFEPTAALLQVLAEYHVQATFFTRGGWVDAQPELTRMIKEGGHEIGNHSYTHESQPSLSDEDMRWELRRTRDALGQVVGETQSYYRPPYGEYNDRDVALAGEEGYRFTVMWSVDSIDWMEPGEEVILQRVGYNLQDGGIALMHVGVWQTPNILPQVITTLRERGLEPVPLSHILDWSLFTPVEIVVVPGDTWESIARAYNIDLRGLLELNGILVAR